MLNPSKNFWLRLLIPKANRAKFDFNAKPCVNVGYIPEGQKVLLSIDMSS